MRTLSILMVLSCWAIYQVDLQVFQFDGMFIVPNYGERYRVHINDTESLHIGGFIPNLKTIVVIHGFGLNGSQEWNITTTLMESGIQANYFMVSWATQAGFNDGFPLVDAPLDVTVTGLAYVIPLYLEAAKNVAKVAQSVAYFLAWLTDLDYQKGQDIHIIGHSLGAHMAGEIGNNFREWTGQTIGRISGLDPAAPLFTLPPVHRKLTKDDASFVDIYHSNALLFGAAPGKVTGDLIFIINGGVNQPGCVGKRVSVQDNVAFVVCAHLYSEYIFMAAAQDEIEGCDCPYDYGFGKLPECMKACTNHVRIGYFTDTRVRGIRWVRYEYAFGVLPGFLAPNETKDGEANPVVARP